MTNAGGEITVLDSAGYGSVTINKSVSITNEEGVEAGVTTPTAVNAITVNAGLSDVVNLRGLALVGGGVGNFGITVTSGGTVNIEHSVVHGFVVGIRASGRSKVSISDTIVSGNSQSGVFFVPSSVASLIVPTGAIGRERHCGVFDIGGVSGGGGRPRRRSAPGLRRIRKQQHWGRRDRVERGFRDGVDRQLQDCK